MHPQRQEHTVNPEVLEKVTAQRERSLRFLSSRVEDTATAEDILQAAYLKAIERGSEIRGEESTVAWFYRILRNAGKAKALEAFAAEVPEGYKPEMKGAVCKCIGERFWKAGRAADSAQSFRHVLEGQIGATSSPSFAKAQ